MSINVLASRPIVRPISQAETGQFRPKQANFSRLYSDNLKFACTGVLINFTVIFIQEDIKKSLKVLFIFERRRIFNRVQKKNPN